MSQTTQKPKSQAERRFRVRRANPEKVYDPKNPFTHWLRGTDACNEEFDKEKERRKYQAKSAGSDGRRLPYHDRLSKPAGVYTREGFFRKLKNELSRVE